MMPEGGMQRGLFEEPRRFLAKIDQRESKKRHVISNWTGLFSDSGDDFQQRVDRIARDASEEWTSTLTFLPMVQQKKKLPP